VGRLVETASGSSVGLSVRRRCGRASTVNLQRTNRTGETIRETLCGDRWGVAFLARRRPTQTAGSVAVDVGESKALSTNAVVKPGEPVLCSVPKSTTSVTRTRN
jgi:hypothetical protein